MAVNDPVLALERATAEASARGHGTWVLVTGSLHVVGAVRAAAYGR